MINFHVDDFIVDINPKRWISKFQNTSLTHIGILALFYHVMIIPFILFSQYLPDVYFQKDALFEIPQNAFNNTILVPSIEEILFFGLPHYLSGHPLIVLIVGSSWSIVHLFEPLTSSTYYLSLSAFFTTIPILFFNIRAWKSGKGWFSIATHGGYNFLVALGRCIPNITSCSEFFKNEFDFPGFHIVLALTISLLLITYFLYRKKRLTENANYG